MPSYDHLPLLRYVRDELRRKKPGFSVAITRNPGTHGAKLRTELEDVIQSAAAAPRVEGIDPALILKVELVGAVEEDVWRRNGFQVLAQNPGNIYVLFSTDTELKDFKAKLNSFQGGAQGTVNAPFASLFNTIERASGIEPGDRLGSRLKLQGLSGPGDIDGRESFVIDIEIWDAETSLDRRVRVDRVVKHIEKAGGEILGAPYIGDYGLILIRAKMKGTVLKGLLELTDVAVVDVPPIPDLGEDSLEDIVLATAPPVGFPAGDVPLIGIIDSGLNAHPFLDGLVAERLSVPADLGGADASGHGTRVAGIAAYGDVRECIDRNTFAAPVRLLSVRVVNDHGAFDEKQKVPEQMRNAVKLLAERGCRIINISLGDSAFIPYDDGRASPWAAELDTLVREFGVVIIVSAGNQSRRAPGWGRPEQLATAYPGYLLSPQSRLIDPAYAANVITVGALAHGNGLRVDEFDGVGVRAITAAEEPSPLTRCGPGINGAVKPDFADLGGTCVYDGGAARVVTGAHWESAGMATLSPNYRQALFTAASGTSYAAPRLAFKAALIAARFPQASSNLLRCLLGLSANVPSASVARMTPPAYKKKKPLHKDVRKVVGYGVADPGRVLASDDNRVVFYADGHEMLLDQMALYAIPMPPAFCETKGPRSVRVSLAFDPPVRHTRLEYLGLRMSFQLIRYLNPDEIFEQYRKREDKTRPPEFEKSSLCPVDPSVRARETSTLQVAHMSLAKNFDARNEMFHLAVFTHRRWAGEDDVFRQGYAIAVELAHEGCKTLYQTCSELLIELQQRVDLNA
ncbi:MAG: S8 family peptidase [Hyphomicrobium sp.]|jgi:subtilisin family serine protease|uniref:S8 family peptidase n=1 Tax=Hyphomicrobium sp. DMF-1 TaxID=3019544 RepID=UPI000BD8B6DD|nr:S8 family peptidase [Hyphomicrobium sp. DMF-1]OYW53679.1 MAG: hypothetical protein B7Z29_14595 [Hyphomicrobium sp. 12-62-95]OYX98413.1 MAG: hypothetical protein B7Y80_15365 [Hyphomicrobium sp. 32-62-53]WBT37929.1 S8 family peptidase [Hyphomicrobium sp. DMF-1]